MDGPRTAESIRFLEKIQGSTDRWFGPIFREVCRDPWTAESVQIFQREYRDPRTADWVQIFKPTDGQIGPNF